MSDYVIHLMQKTDLAKLTPAPFCPPDGAPAALYAPPSLASEGFIHLCTHAQLQRVVKLFYPDTTDLFVVIIAPKLLPHKVVYEKSPLVLPDFAADEEFPHYYHALNTDAILDIVEYAAYQTSPITSEVLALMQQYRFHRLPVEGTLYRETWRSAETTAKGHPIGTAMVGLFCQQPESVSKFHQLAYDEVWHHYAGDPLELHLIAPDGQTSKVILGNPNHNADKAEVASIELASTELVLTEVATPELASIALSEPTIPFATTLQTRVFSQHKCSQPVYSQFVVPAGYWQAGRVVAGGNYALYGCTMAPGFHVECFTAATAEELTTLYPNAKTIIAELAVQHGDTVMPELPK